jgi:cytochrome c556
MNDDFLYRIRTQPPPHFAAALKARLDRAPRRRAQVARIGLALLLFGTAFAIVSPGVRQSVSSLLTGARDGKEEQRLADSSASRNTGQGPTDTSRDEPAPQAEGGAFPPDGDGLAPGERGKRINPFLVNSSPSASPHPPAEQAPELSSPTEDPVFVPPSSPASNPGPSAASSGFIVTGPLLAEEGTAAYAFQTRRALFTVIAWTTESLEGAMKSLAIAAHENRRFDVREAELYATRLERLAPLIADAFAQDTRLSEVQTRALDEIWERPEKFGQKIEDIAELAGSLRMSLQQGNRDRAFRTVKYLRRTCTECHQEFRKGGDKNVGTKYP